MNKQKIIALNLVLLMLVSMFSGCAAPNKNSSPTSGAQGINDESYTFPLKDPITIKYWVPIGASAPYMTNLNELPMYQEFEKLTGVKMDFIHPTVGSEREQLNLLIAAKNYPDVIDYNFMNTLAQAVEQGWAIKLNDYLDKYAPNISKLLNENTELRREVSFSDGGYYFIPAIIEPLLRVYVGPSIRKDLLDDYNISPPETIDEWYNMLTTFKTNIPDCIPYIDYANLGMTNYGSVFMGAWGMNYNYQNDNGKIKFGPIQPEFKEYLINMNKWYSEGLIDPMYTSNDWSAYTAAQGDGRACSWTGYVIGGLAMLLSMYEDDPNFDLIGVAPPVLNKGETPIWGHRTNLTMGLYGATITNANKYPELTVKWFDFSFSNEGIMLFNYGIEGTTYTMVNGEPKLTDLIVKNPDGLGPYDIIGKYFRGADTGVWYQLESMYLQLTDWPQQRDALRAWASPTNERMMPILQLSTEDSSTVSVIMADVNTYRDEMVTKFITGQTPLSDFDKYCDEIVKMKIDDAIAIYQIYLDAYYKN